MVSTSCVCCCLVLSLSCLQYQLFQLNSLAKMGLILVVMCKSLASHVQVMCKSCASHVQVMCRSCASHVQIVFNLCSSHVQVVCKSCTSHGNFLIVLETEKFSVLFLLSPFSSVSVLSVISVLTLPPSPC